MTAAVFDRNCRYVDRKGRICGKSFTTAFLQEVLCRRCRRRLPKCGVCRIVMGSHYGYLEGFGRKVGTYKVCGGCATEIARKSYLRITEEKILLPLGTVVRTPNLRKRTLSPCANPS